MSSLNPIDEEKSNRLRQRLWGAAVLIALLVIFLPLLLDGSGSESQYRRVESLRAEPPRVIDAQGNPEPVAQIKKKLPRPVANEPVVLPTVVQDTAVLEPAPRALALTTEAPVKAEALQAWVVQAGSFQDEANALAVRDKLRRAGFPSFVTPNDALTPLFRVRVGPMISLQQAELSRVNVMRLLDREAIVVSYP